MGFAWRHRALRNSRMGQVPKNRTVSRLDSISCVKFLLYDYQFTKILPSDGAADSFVVRTNVIMRTVNQGFPGQGRLNEF